MMIPEVELGDVCKSVSMVPGTYIPIFDFSISFDHHHIKMRRGVVPTL